MPDLWTDLLGCLELRPIDRPPGSDDGAAAYAGRNQRLTYHRLFGGQLLAQMIRAAELSCPAKAVKSIHVLFPRAGVADEPVQYELQRHHEGSSFATLSIVARQSHGMLATAAVSMHAAEDGLEHQTDPGVCAVPGPEFAVPLELIPWEARSRVDLDDAAAGAPELDLWLRTPPVKADLAPALIAYASDLTLIGTALRPLEGISQRAAGTAFTSAVTSHTLWFHRPFRTDGWLLLRQSAPILAHGRSFGHGDVLTRNGLLVASYAQEALVRFQP